MFVLTVFAFGDDMDARELKIVYTGSDYAALEPCGCKSNPAGGVAVRGNTLNKLRAHQTPVLVLNAGDSLDYGKGKIWDKLRSEKYWELLSEMKYQAIAVGAPDLRWGYEFVKELKGKYNLPLVSSNLKRKNTDNLPWSDSLIIDCEGLKVGIIALTRDLEEAGVKDPALYLENPIETMKNKISELEPQTDILILLNTLLRKSHESIIANCTGVDLIINAQTGPMRQINGSDIVSVYSYRNSKYIGVADLVYSPTTDKSLVTFKNEQMGANLPKDPEIQASLDKFYSDVMSDERLKFDKKLFAGYPEEQDTANSYVGADKCNQCHKVEYRMWAASRHYGTYRSMFNDNSYFVPQCFACHVTGYGYPTGFNKVDGENPLRGVQCEACHGPGKKHTDDPEGKNVRNFSQETAIALCKECHTGEYKGNIEEQYDSYYKSIKHWESK
jgi:hypothetical protein